MAEDRFETVANSVFEQRNNIIAQEQAQAEMHRAQAHQAEIDAANYRSERESILLDFTSRVTAVGVQTIEFKVNGEKERESWALGSAERYQRSQSLKRLGKTAGMSLDHFLSERLWRKHLASAPTRVGWHVYHNQWEQTNFEPYIPTSSVYTHDAYVTVTGELVDVAGTYPTHLADNRNLVEMLGTFLVNKGLYNKKP